MSRALFLFLGMLACAVILATTSSLADALSATCYPPLSLVPSSIPSATVGSNYSARLTASGGQPPYTWSLGQSFLPEGFSISSSGNLTGTPAAAGAYVANVVVSDSLKNNVKGVLTLNVTATSRPTTPNPPAVIVVSPARVSTAVGATQQFVASITGTSNSAVTWSVSGTGCSGTACGTISSSGLYTAPSAVPSSATVTVTATSMSEPTLSASVDVTLKPHLGITYYVAPMSDGGNDSNSGLSASTPWQTIAHVNAQKFRPGDSILFQDGGVWREELLPPSSGTSGNPITFGSYGSGAMPVINGSDVIPTWTAYGANIWQASVATQPTELWINGTSLGPPQTSLASLTSTNQWFWGSGTLYIYSVSNLSTGQTVEAASRADDIEVTGKTYITIDGLEVKNANRQLVYLNDSAYVTLQGMKIHDTADEGVDTYNGGGNHLIQNCEIYNTGLTGVFGHGSGIHWLETTTPSIAQNNYIHDLGNVLGTNPPGGTGNHGIYDQGTGDITRYNYFANLTGSDAIKIDANNVLVYGNVFNTVPVGGVYLDAYSGVQILNNTFYNTGTVSGFGLIQYVGDGTQTGIVVDNNAFYVSGSTFAYGIVVNVPDAGFTADYNDIYGSNVVWAELAGQSYNLAEWQTETGQDEHSKFANPLLENPSAGQFWLQPTSPAIGAGVNLGSSYNIGLLPATTWPDSIVTGMHGSKWNMGAYSN